MTREAHGEGEQKIYGPGMAWTTCQRLVRTLTAVGVLASLIGTSAPAQDTTRARVDSLEERLRRAEEAIATLREQLVTEAASTVKSATRVRVDLFGRVLMNAFANSRAVNNVDVPQVVLQGASSGAGGGTIRQSSFGVSVIVDRVLGGRFDGELDTDFFGGQQPSSGGRRFPLLRVRTARGIVEWERAEVLFGQADPLVGGVNPTSVASFGTPEFTASGNIWLWLPQLRGTWTLFRPAGLALQGAILAPTSGDPVLAFDTDADAAERSNRPYLQARLRTRWMVGERRAEIGVGVHRGWVQRADSSLAGSDMIAADVVLPLGSALELRGEVYAGQAIRGLGGGGIGQNLTASGAAVEDRGGWGQLVLRPSTLWSLGAGCGVADPKDVAGLPARRLRNQTCSAHLTLRPDGPLLLSFGWRGQRTTYDNGRVSNRHLNAAFGFEF